MTNVEYSILDIYVFLLLLVVRNDEISNRYNDCVDTVA